MSDRITRADIAVQVAMLESYARTVKLIKDDDALILEKSPGGYSLTVRDSSEPGSRRAFAPLGGFGVLGSTAKDAHRAAWIMQETLWSTCQALGIQTTYPAEKVAAIRGEK